MQLKKMKTVVEQSTSPAPVNNAGAIVTATDEITVQWKDFRDVNMDPIVNYKSI